MPGADNPYREIHRDGLVEARNAADFGSDVADEYNPRHDPDLNQRAGPPIRKGGRA